MLPLRSHAMTVPHANDLVLANGFQLWYRGKDRERPEENKFHICLAQRSCTYGFGFRIKTRMNYRNLHVVTWKFSHFRYLLLPEIIQFSTFAYANPAFNAYNSEIPFCMAFSPSAMHSPNWSLKMSVISRINTKWEKYSMKYFRQFLGRQLSQKLDVIECVLCYSISMLDAFGANAKRIWR